MRRRGEVWLYRPDGVPAEELDSKGYAKKSVPCFVHGFFQSQDGDSQDPVAVVELLDGRMLESMVHKVRLEPQPSRVLLNADHYLEVDYARRTVRFLEIGEGGTHCTHSVEYREARDGGN